MGEVACEIALGLKRSDHNLYSTYILKWFPFRARASIKFPCGLRKDILQKCYCNRFQTRTNIRKWTRKKGAGKAVSVL